MKVIDVVIPVKNGGSLLLYNTNEWLFQQLPDGWRFNIYIVNDGSNDGIPERLAEELRDQITIITHIKSKGRASACNAGADAGNGDYIAFFDADCTPVSKNVLGCYLPALKNGTELAFGQLKSRENGLWAKYSKNVNKQREVRFQAGDKKAFTTANFICSRKIFAAVGGFDVRYMHYGFEDRDLIVRLIEKGAKPTFVPEASVIHDDLLDLTNVCRKMRTAGHYSAGIFMADHPETYRKMHYSKIDVRCRGIWLHWLASAIRPLLNTLLSFGEITLKSPIPYTAKAAVIKLCSGISYLVGTDDGRY